VSATDSWVLGPICAAGTSNVKVESAASSVELAAMLRSLTSSVLVPPFCSVSAPRSGRWR
jgi:hypothetical protein